MDRRELLQAALVLVGGLTATACSSQPSPCTPLACDLGDGGPGDDGATDGAVPDDAGVVMDGSQGGRDGGRRHDGGVGRGRGAPPPCPPSGYICQESDPGYVGAGGGVG